jgi:hypothetical protein
MLLHLTYKKWEISCSHIGQRMRPIFKDIFIDRLSLMQMAPLVARNTGPEYVMVTALDDVNCVYLNITKMLDCKTSRLRPITERSRGIQTLSLDPHVARLTL